MTTFSVRRTTLICAIFGLDDADLAKRLLERGYRMGGTSRDALTSGFRNFDRLVHDAQRIALKGASRWRKPQEKTRIADPS